MVSRLRTLLRNLVGKKRLEDDLDDEIRFYLETLTQQEVAAGMSEQEARRAARLELGSVDSLKDAVGDIRMGATIERIGKDVCYACRVLSNKPGFTAAAVFVLALGIGANGAMFSVVNAFLLKPLAIAKPDELMGLYSRDTKLPDVYRGFSYPDFADIRNHNPVFSSLMAHTMIMVGLKQGDETRRIFADFVSSNYFSGLGVPLAEGRPFTKEEEKPGRQPVVIVTEPYWRKAGSDPHILGKQLRINGHLFTVIGVTPKGFTGTTALVSPAIFLPLGNYDVGQGDAGSRAKPLAALENKALILVGRLKASVTRQSADAMLAVIAGQMAKASPAENKDQMLFVQRLSRLAISTNPADNSGMRLPAILLMSLSGVVLLVACLNLANMMMAKGAARRKEIAVRLAIGGSRQRIVQQLVIEALIVAVLGAAASLVVASVSTALLIGSLSRLMPLNLVYDAAPDVRVVGVTLIFCVVSTVIFGLFPSWRLSKPDTWSDLKSISGENTDGVSGGLFSRGKVMVVAQLSLSLMLLSAAGMFVRSAVKAAKIEPGFAMENEVLAEVDAGAIGYDEAHARRLYGALKDRLKTIPGIQSVAMAATVPFGTRHLGDRITPAETVVSKEHPAVNARFNTVTDDYFETLDIPLVRGRSFTAAESMPDSKSHVAIIDQLAADKLWPGRNALGGHIRFGGGANGKGEILEVIGVVKNIRESILGSKYEPHVYLPFGQQHQADTQIHLKTTGSGSQAEARLLDTIRQEIRATDERLPVLELTTMRRHLESGLEIWVVRSGAYVLGIFGAVALFLSVIGLYAVNAFTVARRTREIGIRMAIGADASSTLRMILGEGVRVTAVGLGIGLLLASGLDTLLGRFLYGIHGAEPLVVLAASAILASVALLACYLPARRASRIEPMIALRYE